MKGQMREELVPLILLLIAAAVIAVVIIKNNWMSEATEREVCKTSVIERWGASKINAEGLFDLQCKSHLTKIKYEDIVDEKNPESAIKKAFADQMYDCWYKFNRGKLNLEGVLKAITNSEREVCVICSQITFDEEIKKKYPIVKGFNQWLIDTKVPGQSFTYAQYFSNDASTDWDKLKEAIPKDYGDINTSNTYQIIFYVKEGASESSLIKSGIFAGAVGGAAEAAYLVAMGATGPIGWVVGAATVAAGFIGAEVTDILQAGKVTPALLAVPVSQVPKSCKRFY